MDGQFYYNNNRHPTNNEGKVSTLKTQLSVKKHRLFSSDIKGSFQTSSITNSITNFSLSLSEDRIFKIPMLRTNSVMCVVIREIHGEHSRSLSSRQFIAPVSDVSRVVAFSGSTNAWKRMDNDEHPPLSLPQRACIMTRWKMRKNLDRIRPYDSDECVASIVIGSNCAEDKISSDLCTSLLCFFHIHA